MNQNTSNQPYSGIKLPSVTSKPFWREMMGLALFAIAYWLTIRIGLLFVAQPEGVASVWPASGVTLAILLLRPKRKWPVLISVVFVTNAIGNLNSGNSLLVSLGYALANSFEAALAAWVLTYFFKSKITFENISETLSLLFVAIFINGITSILGATVSVLAFHGSFWDSWLIWWSGDGLGMILVTPIIVGWATSKSVCYSALPRNIVKTALPVLILMILAWLLYGNFTVAEKPLGNYMIFPLLIWLALRLTSRDISTVLLLFSVIAIWNTLQGYGIFGYTDLTQSEHLVTVNN